MRFGLVLVAGVGAQRDRQQVASLSQQPDCRNAMPAIVMIVALEKVDDVLEVSAHHNEVCGLR